MARSVPAIDGTPDFTRVSMTFTDFTGDQRSVSALGGPAVSAAQIEAAVDAMAEYSNAVLWRVEVTGVYEGSSSKTQASDETYPSVYDNVVVLFRNGTTRQTQNMFVPAPVQLLFVPGTDNPNVDPTSDLSVLTALWEAMIGSASYNAISARFTERREINQAQKY